MKRIFLVAFDMPPGSTVEMAQEYVADAVRSFCGGMHPEDEMFDLDKKSVVVQHVKKTLLR